MESPPAPCSRMIRRAVPSTASVVRPARSPGRRGSFGRVAPFGEDVTCILYTAQLMFAVQHKLYGVQMEDVMTPSLQDQTRAGGGVGEPAVEASGLRKAYGDQIVLDGVDLRVPAGTVLALLGPNGVGKTTTVQILTTLLEADGGVATVAGHDVRREGDAVRAAIGLTGQFAAVDDLLTGEENLAMMAALHHLGRAERRRRTAELLTQFDLVTAARRAAATYSGGMRRRLDIAMGLVGRPRVLFLDEPTTGLDPRSRRDVWQLVRDLMAGGTTVFLTTQYLEEADRLADQIALLDRGRLVAQGTPDELK